MKRREFITLLGGAAAAWPLAARAQQPPQPVRRIGVLMTNAEHDSEAQQRVKALNQGLEKLGWAPGRTVRIDYRFAVVDADRTRNSAAELVALAPDVILAHTPAMVAALKQATDTIPIVFVQASDPISLRVVTGLSHPSGNVTGFVLFEPSLAGKWLQFLTEVSPRITRALVLQGAANPSSEGFLRSLQAVASSPRVSLESTEVRDALDIERAVSAIAAHPNSGLIVFPSPIATAQRDLIIRLAARHRLPAVYPFRFFVTAGGLMFYGANNIDQWRQAASYVDRIFLGTHPRDLPIQLPTKFDLAINLKTAKALGLEVPPTVLARRRRGDRMKRREFITLLGGAAAWPLPARAQQPAKVAQIGFLDFGPASARASRVEALQGGLRDLGYVEGENIVFRFRWVESVEQLPELAAQLVRMNVDVILAMSSTMVEPARRATKTIPIVFAAHADPVGVGHVASLARPGGNITGMSMLLTELAAKELEILIFRICNASTHSSLD